MQSKTNLMKAASLDRLAQLCVTIPARLKGISQEGFSYRPAPTKWSKKEILGHLIDSASHQHHKLVRGQAENNPCIAYDQDQWANFGFYQQMGTAHLIDLWTVYNQQLLELSRLIPEESLQRTCKGGDGKERTLLFLMQDYVNHLEHHLRQLLEVEKIE